MGSDRRFIFYLVVVLFERRFIFYLVIFANVLCNFSGMFFYTFTFHMSIPYSHEHLSWTFKPLSVNYSAKKMTFSIRIWSCLFIFTDLVIFIFCAVLLKYSCLSLILVGVLNTPLYLILWRIFPLMALSRIWIFPGSICETQTINRILGINRQQSLHKKLYFHLIFWCGSFVETHSSCRVSEESSETLWKLCLFTKFAHQEIRWNCGIFHSKLFGFTRSGSSN